MNVLVKAGGELYIPVNKCSAGVMHYCSVDAEPIEINVNPKRPALRYLRRLIGKLKRIEISDEPTERVNLLYEKDGAELDVDIDSLTNSKVFDFWVKKDWLKSLKFQYKHNKIFADDKKIDGKQRIRDLFGKKYTLELTHVGSPGVELRHMPDDESIVNDLYHKEIDKKEKELIEKITASVKDIATYPKDKLSELGITELSILYAIASSEEPQSVSSVFEYVKDLGYECPCIFEDLYDGEDFENYLKDFCEKGLIADVDGEFVFSLENYQKYKAEQLEEELDREFYGLGYVAGKDIISAALLLSLKEEPQRIKDIMQYLKNRSFIKMDDDDSEVLGPNDCEVKKKLMELKNEGKVNESDGWFEIAYPYLRNENPSQFSFDI